MKENKMYIEQNNGIVKISRNGELEKTYDFNRIVENIQNDRCNSVRLANLFAEIIHDCLLSKSVIHSSLKDLNATASYLGTYFQYLDVMED